ncbi:Squamous cell carcinoma antigen recognized by T-cells 3 [Anabarilius grahami]|uniref:Squamous cell carcinoma antigen recognized by T-cells 3 n=1 Tax=Anabarilius grahami TaxID=495550 RepID=A0A3N0XHB8_ANAGA|nr:Squamous cell carcinoma antigen recognized by T-cells 3 [Anabarilius grahami]
MAATGNEEQTLLPDIEEEAEGMEREMESEEEEEEGMGVEHSEEEDEEDTSEDERENEAEIQRLEEQLSINAFDYNCHVDLIKLLRQEAKLHRLRKARQKMSELFPLTEEIWLDWLKDEIRLTEDESDREKVYELFERAIKDYVCPEIWLEYVQYSIGGMGAQGGIERVRSIFERALTAVGLHVTKGASIWEAYREFEIVILSTVQPPPGSVPSQEQQELLNAQLDRIHKLFRRQLAVPLMDMEGTYAEYSDWADDGVPETVTHQYRRALQQMEKCKPYEEALLVSETPKLAEYQVYIDFEIKEGDPARVQIIFERALAENCLVPDLWIKYTTYLDRQLKIKDLVLSAHERAVRNCPWTMGLWKSYLLALERHGADHQTVTEWSRELDELRAAFARSLDYLKQDVEERFSESGDLSCTIMQIWAKIEALHCKNMQKARELWDSIMTKGNAKYANMWLEYYNLERSYGDATHCRKALHRAVQCTSDYPEHVCDVLLNFERVEGSLEDWDAAVQKTDTKLNRVNEQRARVAEKEALLARQEEEKAEHRRKAKADKKGQKKSQKANRTGDKRKAEDECEDEWGEDAEMPFKRLRGEEDFGCTTTEELMETESGLFGRRAPPQRKTEPPGFRKNQQGMPEASREPQDVSKEQRKDENSVFVSNLAFNLEDPEGKLRTLFGGCGTVQQVRLVYTPKGVFRGYCYVQFEDRLAVPEALKLDRQEVDGRPMYVSPCVDKNKNPDFKVFKYKTSLEKHKIFISGLPYTCTKETLEDLFKEHGTIRAIRLVTNRSGKPKGLAYVEYENEAQASKAVQKMDGTMLENFTLSVAISNPPSRKMEDKAAPSRILGAVMQRQPQGARGKGRTQISLLPRSLYRQSAPDAKAENGTISAPHATVTDGVHGGPGTASLDTQTKSLSNEDFARMLLKK